jgi:hypothetical protein
MGILLWNFYCIQLHFILGHCWDPTNHLPGGEDHPWSSKIHPETTGFDDCTESVCDLELYDEFPPIHYNV